MGGELKDKLYSNVESIVEEQNKTGEITNEADMLYGLVDTFSINLLTEYANNSPGEISGQIIKALTESIKNDDTETTTLEKQVESLTAEEQKTNDLLDEIDENQKSAKNRFALALAYREYRDKYPNNQEKYDKKMKE